LSDSDFDCLIDKNDNCTFFINDRYKSTKNNPQVCIQTHITPPSPYLNSTLFLTLHYITYHTTVTIPKLYTLLILHYIMHHTTITILKLYTSSILYYIIHHTISPHSQLYTLSTTLHLTCHKHPILTLK
jgi:hypothetical protein